MGESNELARDRQSSMGPSHWRDFLVFLWDAQRQRSPAAGSGRDAGADAVGSQVQRFVRCGMGTTLRFGTHFLSLAPPARDTYSSALPVPVFTN
jgi:hypothetical protein